MKPRHPILIGNAFPLSLVRRRVVIEPRPAVALRRAARGRRIVSFWGHHNTLAAARAFLGADVTPATPRPALELDAAGRPMLQGRAFNGCWILSPVYTPGYRPKPGAEVPPARIPGWHVLRLSWPVGRPSPSVTTRRRPTRRSMP